MKENKAVEIVHKEQNERVFVVHARSLEQALHCEGIPVLGSDDPERGTVCKLSATPDETVGCYWVTAEYS
jgi:hypothetical protein